MKTKIIATGISGLVGSRIQELLGNKYRFVSFSLDKGIDITNLGLLRQKFVDYKEAEIVLHLAAFTDVTAAFNQNEDKNGSCFRVNVVGSKNIAQLCRQTKKYLIYISTDFVFDGKNPSINGYTEKNQPNPIEWYGKTKYLAEQEIIKSGTDYCILRIAFPYKAKKANVELEPIIKLDLVRNIIEKFKRKEEIKMFADQIITPTFIDDIARVIDSCVAAKPQGIYHCVGSTYLSPYQLTVKIADFFNLDKSFIKKSNLRDYLRENPNSRPRQKNLSLSNNKLEKELGIKMLTIDKGLERIKSELS